MTGKKRRNGYWTMDVHSFFLQEQTVCLEKGPIIYVFQIVQLHEVDMIQSVTFKLFSGRD